MFQACPSGELLILNDDEAANVRRIFDLYVRQLRHAVCEPVDERSRIPHTPQRALDIQDVRRDTIDYHGVVTLRHRSRLHHIGVGRIHTGKRVIVLVDGLDVRVLTQDGELLRLLTLDPGRDYQPTGRPRGQARMS